MLRALAPLTVTLAAAFAAACASTPTPPAAALPSHPLITPEVARAKLRAVSKNKVQLWVVVHVRAHKTLDEQGQVDEAKLLADALSSADAVVNGGGDMIILINSRTDMPLYEKVIAAVRQRHPTFPLGISALSYGPSNLTEGFRLAAAFDAQMVWCETVPDEQIEFEDDDGSYTRADVTPLALALDTQARLKPSALHTAGVHMKYTRPLDGKTFEEAMQAALGKVDGINVTGPKTGELADVARIQAARRVAGAFPIGLASGVSVENVGDVIGLIDYAIVGTSLKFPDNPLRTSEARVRELRHKMDTLGGGAQP
jgi:predicted TIM-barrel enzyme